MKYISLAMQTTDTSVIPTVFLAEKTWDCNWNKNGNNTNYFIFNYAIGVPHIIVSICKLIFILINLMGIISDINMWLWQCVITIYVVPSTMVIESVIGLLFMFFIMPTVLFSNHFMCVHHLCLDTMVWLMYYVFGYSKILSVEYFSVTYFEELHSTPLVRR